MASPVIVYIRRLEKGTNTVGRRPTPKPSLWHTNGDWDNQDLYAREIYVNTAEGKAFITNDTDIFNLARDDGQHDYVSANTLALEDVFFHKITNVSNEIRLINNFIETYFQWRGGSSIVIEVLAGETVKHLYTANGNAKPIKLSSNGDFTAIKDVLLHLVYDENTEVWKEIGSTSFTDNFTNQIGDSIVKFDHHTHIVTQAEAEGGNFTFEVPNVIAKNMGIHVYCNQMPLTLNKGYSVDLESETSKEVTILKNNSDETYFAIKTGWPIFVGYYYKVAVPGTPENPPEPLSMVTLDSVTHESPDNPEEEYNAANDVKFILHFSNTGSAAESLNLLLPLTHSSGGTYATQSITHSVPPGGNTYEIIYRGLGNTDGPNTYTQSVLGDRQSSDSVTVPAKTASFTGAILGCNRQTTDTLSTAIRITNISSIVGTKTVYVQLDSGTKIPITGTVYGGQYNNYFYTWNSVSSAAHTVTLYDTNQTTVLDTWEVAALASNTIIDGSEVEAKELAYRLDGVFAYSASNWHVAHVEPGVDIGTTGGGGGLTTYLYRVPLRSTTLPNISSITSVKLYFTIQVAVAPPAGTDPDIRILNIQVHESNKDYRYSQNYNDLYNGFVNNDIITNKQLVQAADSEYGVKTLILTLNGNYFENISDGYKGLLVKFNSTIEAIVPASNGYGCTLFQMLLKKIEIIP